MIIGDTPSDVTCGRPVGARAIAVATGSYRRGELVAAGARGGVRRPERDGRGPRGDPPVSLTLVDVPELGPALGRMVRPPAASTDREWPPLDDLRLGLATRLFELAGSARNADGAAAERLTASAWRQAWEETVHAVAARAADQADARMLSASRGARMPGRRLARHLLSLADRRALTARLGEGAVSLYAALESLESARRTLADRPLRAGAGEQEWRAAVEAAARRQETAWLALESAWERDRPVWEQEVASIRRWQRPVWPEVVSALLLFATATWLGLILSGYLPVPGPLRGVATFVWERL